MDGWLGDRRARDPVVGVVITIASGVVAGPAIQMDLANYPHVGFGSKTHIAGI